MNIFIAELFYEKIFDEFRHRTYNSTIEYFSNCRSPFNLLWVKKLIVYIMTLSELEIKEIFEFSLKQTNMDREFRFHGLLQKVDSNKAIFEFIEKSEYIKLLGQILLDIELNE